MINHADKISFREMPTEDAPVGHRKWRSSVGFFMEYTLPDTPRNDTPKVEELVEADTKTALVYEVYGEVIKRLKGFRNGVDTIKALANLSDDAMFREAQRLDDGLQDLIRELGKIE